jgi:hypothetical protein
MSALKKVVDTYLNVTGFKKPDAEAPKKEPAPVNETEEWIKARQKENLADPKKSERIRIMNERIKRTNRPMEAPEPLPAALQPEPVKAPTKKKRETYSATEE